MDCYKASVKMPASSSKPQLAGAMFIIITTGIFTPSAMSQMLEIQSPVLYNGSLACPGDEVIFACETRGSSIISWTSEEYIGPGGTQIQFAAGVSSTNIRQIGTTIATLTGDRMENGVQILTSILRVIASLMYPKSSVTCSHIDNEASRTVHFNVIVQPNLPRDAIAFQVNHPIGNCVITTVWRGPDNLAESPLSNYTIIVNSSTPLLGDSVESVTEVNTNELDHEQLSSVIFVPACGRHAISLKATNICGQTSPSVTVALNEDDCFISQNSVCTAENMHTSTLPDVTNKYMATTASANKNNAADTHQATLDVGIGVVVFVALNLLSFSKLT